MLRLVATFVSVFSELLRFGALYFRSSAVIRAENLALRRQLAGYVERSIKPKRVDFAMRVNLALFTRFFDWRAGIGSWWRRNRTTASVVDWVARGSCARSRI